MSLANGMVPVRIQTISCGKNKIRNESRARSQVAACDPTWDQTTATTILSIQIKLSGEFLRQAYYFKRVIAGSRPYRAYNLLLEVYWNIQRAMRTVERRAAGEGWRGRRESQPGPYSWHNNLSFAFYSQWKMIDYCTILRNGEIKKLKFTEPHT